MKKLIALATMVALLGGSIASAQDDEGVTYYDSYGTTGLSPTIAAGVITAAAVVAVLVNNGQHGSSTSHNHFHASSSRSN